MAVFEQAHQDTIDRINDDGWRYLGGRVDRIIEAYDAKGAVSDSFIGIQVKGIEVIIERDAPVLEWRLIDRDLQSFTRGFGLSVGADPESTSNRVICKPFDWYMLCIALEIGLHMAFLGIATSKAA
jgi:hypothetical protein